MHKMLIRMRFAVLLAVVALGLAGLAGNSASAQESTLDIVKKRRFALSTKTEIWWALI
jgi:hypothetical protein